MLLALLFHQILNPLHNTLGTTLIALIPIVLLLVLLALLRMSAWQAVIIGAVVTVVMAIVVWHSPPTGTLKAWLFGSFTGIWAIDWITFWGVVLYNTLIETGAFESFKQWVILQATADIRVQAILLAWSMGALLEGLVGFGYPWAVVAPILIGLGVVELDAIRVAAIANNAPVSFGALGVPIIALAAVTGIPLMHLSESIGRIVAVLALAPPWILIVLVTGKKGLRHGWPLAIVGSLSYIAGQYPTSQILGPYLPDIIGSLVSFAALLILLKFWQPKVTLGYGGVPIETKTANKTSMPFSQAKKGLFPFLILIIVVTAWTGPWSALPGIALAKFTVDSISSLSHHKEEVAYIFSPFIGGTSILAAWILISLYLRATTSQIKVAIARSWKQMWGAILVGPFIFGLAEAFNYSGMANSLAYGFSQVGPIFIVLAPILGWIGVALSGSNTATNAVFGQFQLAVGKILHFPLLLTPSLNSVGSEVGKPIAPQTASVGVSTSSFVRKEGDVIRHNMGWTLVILGYLILVGLLYYFILPGAMNIK